ncbi:MAG: hypothetical protein ACE5OR_00665 [bacterium]
MEKARLVPIQKSSGLIRCLCEELLRNDPHIRDIIQFGSSIYAPDAALDIDLVVTTHSKRDYAVYLEAAVDSPVTVDLMVREPGEKIGKDIAAGLRKLFDAARSAVMARLNTEQTRWAHGVQCF